MNRKNDHNLGLEWYGSTKVGERGQVVIPKGLRDRLRLKKGDSLLVMEQHGAVILSSAEMMKKFASEFLKNIQKIK